MSPDTGVGVFGGETDKRGGTVESSGDKVSEDIDAAESSGIWMSGLMVSET